MSADSEPSPGAYVEVAVDADAAWTEELIGLMSQLGFEGFWEDETVLKCYMSGDRWKPTLLPEVEKMVALLVRSSVTGFPKISVRTLEEQNWNEAWERTVQPIRITPRVVVAPTWNPYTPQEGELLVTINPKMSFGTGYHESTRLAARLLEEFLQPGMRVLDIGTGTGILAIAAVKLGAQDACGIDTDEWAYANARENVDLNQVQTRVSIQRGSVTDLPGDLFDLILANIQRDVIKRLLGTMIDRLQPSGRVILSGLLESDGPPMEHTVVRSGLSVIRRIQEADWIALAAERPRNSTGNPIPSQ